MPSEDCTCAAPDAEAALPVEAGTYSCEESLGTGGSVIEQVIESYTAAVRAKDAAAFAALYEVDVRAFDTWSWSVDGGGAVRTMADEWFGSLGSDQVAVEFDDVRSTVGDDVAVIHAFLTFRGLSAEGDELRSMNNRLTWGLRRAEDGSWKIAHEHTSAPAEFETGKVSLQR
jgi:uncharacterized protein (TIGR02246 family)